MYPSKGSNLYGQQQFGSHQTSVLGSQETDISGGYRGYISQAQYGGQYASVYGSATGQISGATTKVGGSTNIQSRPGFAPAIADTAKFAPATLGSSLGTKSDDYASAGYKGDQFSSATERRYYGESQTSYLTTEPARRYTDPVGASHQSQPDVRDHIDQSAMLHQQQLLKSQSLQSGSDIRQADYLAARSATLRHGHQDLGSYAGRVDPLLATTYGGQHASSLLGAAPRRNVDDLVYAQDASNAGYAVGLPPGRDYIAGKGVLGSSLDPEYQLGISSRAGLAGIGSSMLDGGRGGYQREFEIREEERRMELLLLEKERERDREREREREWERERERERERDRERERERDRERERERDRERQRERDHERERARLLERREKEKERESRRGLELHRERSPRRSSRERHGSSNVKDAKISRRLSPNHETSHRRHSPPKEKNREYICKVNSFSLVECERDYLSINKRYSRLSISADFSKLVVCWPKAELHVSLHTPVSFEHGHVDLKDETEHFKPETMVESGKDNHCDIVWNAKVILMSGISKEAMEELCSDKSSSDKVPHINNILKFAVMKKDRSFMAIGGPWNVSIDGGDPSVDDSILIRTASRHLKDISNLELQNCHHWNRFLEIHYDRFGSDGLFSHKEITVLFLPDLSECLPDLELWRNQWLEKRRKEIEKEKKISLKEKEGSEKEPKQGNDAGSKAAKGDLSNKGIKTENSLKDDDNKGCSMEKEVDGGNTGSNGAAGGTMSKNQKNVKVNGKIAIRKVADKKTSSKDVVGKPDVKSSETAVGKINLSATSQQEKPAIKSSATSQQEKPASDSPSIKTPAKRKIVSKVPLVKPDVKDETTLKKEDAVEATTLTAIKSTDAGPLKDDLDTKKESNEASAKKGTVVKKVTKKKIIRKVIRRKVKQPASKGTLETENQSAVEGPNITSQKVKEEQPSDMFPHVDKSEAAVVKALNETNKSNATVAEKKDGKAKTNEHDVKAEKVEKKANQDVELEIDTVKIKEEKLDKRKENTTVDEEKSNSKILKEGDDIEGKCPKKTTDDIKAERVKEEEKKDNISRHESKHKSTKEVKDKVRAEDAPRHPGLFLQTRRGKETKIRSMSLSLEGILDYNEKDLDESTFELSLFAESFNEMIQFQMGCRLLSFLEKLRKNFMLKRSQQKRERDEQEKLKEESSRKRSKFTDCPEKKSGKSDVQGDVGEDDKTMAQDNSTKDLNESKETFNASDDNIVQDMDSSKESDEVKDMNNAEDEDDDMEEEFEDPEEVHADDEEMEETGNQSDEAQVAKAECKVSSDERPDEKVLKDSTKGIKKKIVDDDSDRQIKEKSAEAIIDAKEIANGKEAALIKKADEEKTVIDKELLQAFRYFDRNRVGYIKVEDLRCIIHSLGKFLPHRDVKEMVQAALLETNVARDNRILYNKLVKMSDL